MGEIERAPVSAFSHVQLRVADVATSEQWYTTALGMDRLAADEAGTYVALRHPPSRVVIVLSQRPDTGAGLDSTLDHLAFAVREESALRAWADHLTAAGIAHSGIEPELDNLSLQLQDPDGTSIELVTRNPASRTPHIPDGSL
jgi:glyoxylase I family protein